MVAEADAVGGDGAFDADAAVVAMRVDALLDWAGSASSVAEARHRLDAVVRAFRQVDPGVATRAQRERARALGVSERDLAEPDAPPPHAVRVPLVLAGQPAGLLRFMLAVSDPTVHGGYDLVFGLDAARAVSDAIHLALRRAGITAGASRWRFVTLHPDALAHTRGTFTVEGPSLGAAAFVSAYASCTDRPVHAGVAISARLAGDQVRGVGRLDAKGAALLGSRTDVQRLIVATADAETLRDSTARWSGVEVVGVATLDELIGAALGPAPRARTLIRHRVADLRREVDGGWLGFRWQAVRERIERTLADVPDARPDLKVEALSMLGAVQEHLGLPDESLKVLEEGVRLANTRGARGAIPDLVRTHLHQHLAMTWRRLGGFAEGRRAARTAIAAARRGRMCDEQYKSLGCAGLVELSAGRPKGAVRFFEEARELVHRHAPEGCVRTHAYVIEALGRAGALRRAQKEYQLALQHLTAHTAPHARTSVEAWLRTSYASALVGNGRATDAIALLEVPVLRATIASEPLPGLLARRHLGVALARTRRAAEGYDLLAPSPFAYGSALEPGLMLAAQANVLCEALARLDNRDWDLDIQGRSLAELGRLPGFVARVLPPARVARACGAIERAGRTPDRARSMLAGIVEVLTRIA